MKIILLCAFFAAVCLFSQAQGDCPLNGKNVAVGEHIEKCIRYTCHEDGHISALGCPDFRCKVQVGYRDMDLSKPYPECCGGPICEDDKH